MIKAISLDKATYREADDDPRHVARNNYLFQAWDPATNSYEEVVRDYIRSSQTKLVKLWIHWRDFPATRPLDRANLWDTLNTYSNLPAASTRPMFHRLDRQIAQLNADGVGVVLAVYHNYPDYANAGTHARHGPTLYPSGHLAGSDARWKAFPDSVDADSYWGWFIAYLIGRYTRASVNSVGPTAANVKGNPYGAFINGLEFINEPNLNHWPQSEAASQVATMYQTAASLAASWGWAATGQYLLGPAVIDLDTTTTHQTAGETFTSDVLRLLRGFRPQVYCGWSQHNYGDIDQPLNPVPPLNLRSRAERTAVLLASYGWHDVAVWLTEGASQYPSAAAGRGRARYEATQSTRISETFLAAGSTGVCPIFSQHRVLDDAGSPRYWGFRRASLDAAQRYVLGPPAPAWSTWSSLPAS
jgi:hypothetical protein